MQTEFALYNGPDLWAASDVYVPYTPMSSFVTHLRPRHPDCHPAALNEAQVEFGLDVEPVTGWLTCRARIVIDRLLFADYKPLTWYVDEPTDWHSGIARWGFPETPGKSVPGIRGEPSWGSLPVHPGSLPAHLPTRWALTVRRSA